LVIEGEASEVPIGRLSAKAWRRKQVAALGITNLRGWQRLKIERVTSVDWGWGERLRRE
jgi:hypothetical protein